MRESAMRGSRYTFTDLALFVWALPLARRAQKVQTQPIPQVVADMAGGGKGGRRHDVERLALAAARATNRWSRWFGGLDTCLVRSLVVGAMLEGRGKIVLHIGFRPGETEASIDGHAWVTADHQAVGSDGSREGQPYSRVLAVPFTAKSEDGCEPNA